MVVRVALPWDITFVRFNVFALTLCTIMAFKDSFRFGDILPELVEVFEIPLGVDRKSFWVGVLETAGVGEADIVALSGGESPVGVGDGVAVLSIEGVGVSVVVSVGVGVGVSVVVPTGVGVGVTVVWDTAGVGVTVGIVLLLVVVLVLVVCDGVGVGVGEVSWA